MLSREDNELLCRVGPGTPMGDLMRQYWIPALMSSELPEPDCPPVRVRLLGENLIAFRATSGKVGLIQNACPHRGASLFFGRNEEEGLRCVYHGWKFDCDGACVDMPTEPAESNFKSKVRATRLSVRRAQRHRLDLHGAAPDAAAPARPRAEHAARGASTPCRRSCASATGSRRSRATSTRSPRLPAPRRRQARADDAGHVRLLRRGQDRAPRSTRWSTPSSARPTAPTARPRKTRTTGASPTSCSRSSR